MFSSSRRRGCQHRRRQRDHEKQPKGNNRTTFHDAGTASTQLLTRYQRRRPLKRATSCSRNQKKSSDQDRAKRGVGVGPTAAVTGRESTERLDGIARQR